MTKPKRNWQFTSEELDRLYEGKHEYFYEYDPNMWISYGNCEKCYKVGPIDTYCVECWEEDIEKGLLGTPHTHGSFKLFKDRMEWVFANDKATKYWTPTKLAKIRGVDTTPQEGYVLSHDIELDMKMIDEEGRPLMKIITGRKKMKNCSECGDYYMGIDGTRGAYPWTDNQIK